MRKLLFSVTKKDLDIDFYSGHGPGGTNRNKHQNCVRIFHRDSGARVTGQEWRERPANIRAALNRLVQHPKFRVWHARRMWEIQQKTTLEEHIDKLMAPDNLRVEVRGESGWQPMEETT